MWWLRWHIVRLLVWAAIEIAPRGEARDRMIHYLNAFGREIVTEVVRRRA